MFLQSLLLSFLILYLGGQTRHILTLCVGLGRVKSAKSFVDLNLALALLLEIFVHLQFTKINQIFI